MVVDFQGGDNGRDVYKRPMVNRTSVVENFNVFFWFLCYKLNSAVEYLISKIQKHLLVDPGNCVSPQWEFPDVSFLATLPLKNDGLSSRDPFPLFGGPKKLETSSHFGIWKLRMLPGSS